MLSFSSPRKFDMNIVKDPIRMQRAYEKFMSIEFAKSQIPDPANIPFTIQEIMDLMCYTIEFKQEPSEEENIFRKVHPNYNPNHQLTELSVLLDRVLSRIKSVTTLEYPLLESEIKFQRLNNEMKKSDFQNSDTN